ncbi:MAG TPA: LytTR family DNA-binding domain-containing protein [Bacteroidia bacterium]|nr:LytTR family DNA-binding domain-containing protein [Bacteroidia bacterium]
MNRKLKCVLVDDDPIVIEAIKDLLRNSPIAEITHSFTNPRKFIKSLSTFDFDLCLLDIYMPEMEGLAVARLLQNKPIIFITGVEAKLKEALELAPIDIITKPVKKDRLDKALTKAHSLVSPTKEFEFFNVAENNEKIKLRLADIYFVKADTIDPRNKNIILYNGCTYTLMGCTFEELLEISPGLTQVNKSELVSLDAVDKINNDVITLKGLSSNKSKVLVVFLTNAYRKRFMNRICY